jgi:dTDP-4-amino-4,6-dideoxygalactose transaminase
VPEGARHSAHLYYLLLPDERQRDHVIEGLGREDIGAFFHYVPFHSAPSDRRYGRVAGSLPVTNDVSSRLLRLPLWVGISEEQVNHVIASVREILA